MYREEIKYFLDAVNGDSKFPYSFEEDHKTLKTLLDYSINRHYPYIKNKKNQALALFKVVMENQIKLILH